jgi:hypothetical protein
LFPVCNIQVLTSKKPPARSSTPVTHPRHSVTLPSFISFKPLITDWKYLVYCLPRCLQFVQG